MDAATLNFTFTGSGIVKELRQLKNKDGKVFKHLTKIQALGGTFEITTPEDVWRSLAEGQVITVHGEFEHYNGSAQFIGRRFDTGTPKAAKVA